MSARTLKTVAEQGRFSRSQVVESAATLVIIGHLEEFDPPYLHHERGCFGSLFCFRGQVHCGGADDHAENNRLSDAL